MLCFVDYRISNEELSSLEKLNLTVIKIPKTPLVYPAIDGHVDIQLNIIERDTRTVIISKDLPQDFKDLLVQNNITFIESTNSLERKYPGNVFLNSLILKNYYIHNLKYSDPKIFPLIKDKKLINVNQGYTKCSVLPVNEKALITNDPGIYTKLSEYDFDILLLPYGDISLTGFEYGFIGGVGGMISKNEMAFFGSLDFYKYGQQVKDFLAKYNVSPIYLKNGELIDRGSLLVL